MAEFRFSVNASEVARKMERSVSEVAGRLRQEVEQLSVAAHAFIIKKANDDLTGYTREAFLGEENKNVRWKKVGDSIWVVEIDESAQWIEEGRSQTFMSWLLDKNPKAKISKKDGSRYAHIPMPKDRGAGGKLRGSSPVLSTMVQAALKREGISLRKIERSEDGQPKLGILHKLTVDPPGTSKQFPTLFSAPRSPEMAELTGFKQHSGIFLLKDTVVTQRMGKNKKVIKEAITFRTISSKHEQEGRWMYPEVKPLNSLAAAHEWAKTQWNQIVKRLEEDFNRKD